MTETAEEKFTVDVETIDHEFGKVFELLNKSIQNAEQASRVLDVGGHDTAITVASRMTRVQCVEMIAILKNTKEAHTKLKDLLGNWKMGIGLGDQQGESEG